MSKQCSDFRHSHGVAVTISLTFIYRGAHIDSWILTREALNCRVVTPV